MGLLARHLRGALGLLVSEGLCSRWPGPVRGQSGRLESSGLLHSLGGVYMANWLLPCQYLKTTYFTSETKYIKN